MFTVMRPVLVLLLFVVTLASTAMGRSEFAGTNDRRGGSMALQSPEVPLCAAAHRVGQIVLAVNNNGTFGTGFSLGASGDCFTGGQVNSCEYPKGSSTQYLFAGCFWIGAVIGRDTVVSVGADGWSSVREIFPFRQPMIKRSIIDPESPDFEFAVSEEDYICTYTDTYTVGVPASFGQPHIPINIAVKEQSYAWSYAYAEDFVLFDYQVTSMNTRTIEELYLGLYVDADVYFDQSGNGYADDVTGFLQTQTRQYGGCSYLDTVNIAWLADNDGDLDALNPVPHVTGTRIVRTPAETLQISYNWWFSSGATALDFGPRERPNVGRLKEPFRDFGTGGTGTPEGDRNKYYIMRNQEFDYDQARVASISANDSLWLQPNPDNVEAWAVGKDTRYLLSFGPFEILPGQTLPLSFAYVGGRDLHTVPGNTANLPYDFEAYYENLDFSDLADNAAWAGWIYDNPGVDTDSDGFAGEYRLCPLDSIPADTGWLVTRYDTIWFVGDGIPDFRGATPPPAPKFWLHPSYSQIHVRFNGSRSETAKDLFTREIDFEGYRIYIGRDNRESSYSTVTSYDRENFNRLGWSPERRVWVPSETPFSRSELACLYGDSCNDPDFDPLRYTRVNPWVSPEDPDERYFFTQQDYNSSQLGIPGAIRKVYPDQPVPSHNNPDSADPSELTAERLFKYYEYEFTIENLLPTVPYYVNVTAFDYGSPRSGLPALETSVTIGAEYVIPYSDPDEIARSEPKVVAYPNPYRLDAAYRGMGFEGRSEVDRPDDRVRKIMFANLPPRCLITIFTIDGDLVRKIDHDMSPDDPNASYDEWDLITRNTQMIVSGLYYFTVEAEGRETQIGKIAIIK